MTPETAPRALDFLLMAGRILLESGAETSRIEETLSRMGLAMSYATVDVFCIPTGIIVTLRGLEETATQVMTVEKRGIHLEKVARVNALSRQFEQGHVDLVDALLVLADIDDMGPSYSFLTSFLARGISCAAWATLMGGNLRAFFPAMLAGFVVEMVTRTASLVLPNFMVIFFAALLGSLWAILVEKLGIGAEFRQVAIGVILPLVPGLALTSAVRDLIAGDLVSGVARGAEAVLTAAAIAAGVYTVLLVSKGGGWLYAP